MARQTFPVTASLVVFWFLGVVPQARGAGTLAPWTTIGTLPDNCTGTQVAVVGNFVYTMQGYETHEGDLDTYYAPFNSDGTIGTWQMTSSRSISRFDSRAATWGDYIYLVGGQSSGNVSTSAVEYAQANADGTLSAWTVTTSYADARRGPAVAAYDGYVYVVGGYGPPSLNSVEYTEVQPDGSLDAWQATTATQVVHPYASAFAHDGYLYVLGGQTTGYCTDKVERAPINPDGSLGVWEYDSALPEVRGSAGVALLGDYVYLIGGNDSSVPYTSVVWSEIQADHTLGPWEHTEPVSHGVYWPDAEVWNGNLYFTGGGGGGGGGWIETTVPEPATLALLALGGLSVLGRVVRRRRR